MSTHHPQVDTHTASARWDGLVCFCQAGMMSVCEGEVASLCEYEP